MQADTLFSKGSFYKIVGTTIRKKREKDRCSQLALSKNARINISVLRNLEEGRPFSIETLALVLLALDLEPTDVMPEQSGLITRPHVQDREQLLADYSAIFERSEPNKPAIDRLKAFIGELLKVSGVPPERKTPPDPEYRAKAVYQPQTREEILESFGRRVRIYRMLLGLTANQLAQKCRISLTSLTLIEVGLRNPSIETVYKLAEGLEVSIFWLIPGSHDDLEHMQVLDILAWTMSARDCAVGLEGLEWVLKGLSEAVRAPVERRPAYYQ